MYEIFLTYWILLSISFSMIILHKEIIQSNFISNVNEEILITTLKSQVIILIPQLKQILLVFYQLSDQLMKSSIIQCLTHLLINFNIN